MNIEIKFRGKSLKSYDSSSEIIEAGEWVYGYYYFCRDRMAGIIVTDMQQESGGIGNGIMQVECEVDTKTVGQYIGLEDKNKKEIYSDDTIQLHPFSNEDREKFKLGIGRTDNRAIVKYHQQRASFVLMLDEIILRFGIDFFSNEIIVLGSIHDNLELLEKNNEKN